MFRRSVLLSLCFLLLGSVSAFAQGNFKPPSKEEIEKRVKEAFEELPEATVENDWVTITYKELPCNLSKLVKDMAPKVPDGMDIDTLIKQYEPMARPYIEKYMAKIGSIETKRELEFGSRTLPPGDYIFGLVVKRRTPKQFIIYSEDKEVMKKLRKPFGDNLKRRRVKTPFETLAIHLEADEDKDEEGVYLYVDFDKYKMRSRKYIEYGEES